MEQRIMRMVVVIGVCMSILQAATVSGVVTDGATSGNLEGVIVQLRSAGGGGGGAAIGTDTTGTDGAFSFAEVDAGRYTVRATKTGYVTGSVADTVDSAETESAVTIVLAPVVNTTVSGTVTDSAEGTPVAGVVVQLRSGNRSVATDTTDAEGKYSFAEVETGTYSVRGVKTGYTTKTLSAEVASADPVTVDIPLVGVVMTTVSGTVTDSAAGTPVAGAVVQLRSGNQTVGTDTTGTEGKYSFEEVATGTYTVRGTKTGYDTKTLAAAVTSADPVTVDIPLVGVVTATVSGTVTDSAAGTPVAGAVVQLRSGNQTIGTDTAGTDGKYSFSLVETGRYSVRVSAGNYVTKTVNDSVTSSADVSIDVALAKVALGTITGKVTADSLAGAALEGVVVILSRSGGGAAIDTVTTNAQGAFVFEDVATGSGYTLSGSKTGFSNGTATLRNKQNGADTVNFFLTAIVTKNITVLVLKAADSSAIEGAVVVVSTSGGGGTTSLKTAESSASGAASFSGITTGTYTISASAAGFTARATQYTVRASSADSVALYLAAATNGTKTVQGTVTDSASGGALAGVSVSVRITTGGGGGGTAVTIAATTGADGKYLLTGIPVTTATTSLSLSLSGYRTVARNSTLGTAGQADTTTINIKMQKSAAGVAGPKMAVPKAGSPRIGMRGEFITITGVSGAGVVQVFNLNGKMILQHSFTGTGSTVLSVPLLSRVAESVLLVKVIRIDGRAIVQSAVSTQQ